MDFKRKLKNFRLAKALVSLYILCKKKMHILNLQHPKSVQYIGLKGQLTG